MNPERYFRWNDTDEIKKMIIQQVKIVKDINEWQQSKRDFSSESTKQMIQEDKIDPLQARREALQKRIDRARDGESYLRPKPIKISTSVAKPAPKSLSSVSMDKIKKEGDKYRKGEYDKEELEFALDNLVNIIKRAGDPNMEEKFDFIDMQRKAKRRSMGGRKKPSSMRPTPVKLSSKPLVTFKPAPVKKVVAKKVMKPPVKKVVAKKVMKPVMKKPMKKPIAFGNVETALTGKRPRKAPAKPTQVARFYIGGSVLPKGTKVPMPKKTTTTTMKARKPMSAETKQKIKNGVKAYHKNCKKAMAMYSTMKK